MNTTELSPCPFCGAQPKTGFHGDEDGGYHYVECLSCRRPKELDAERFIGAHGESALDAIAAWNTRASPAPGRAPLTELQCREIYWSLDKFGRDVDHYEYGLPMLDYEDRLAEVLAVIRDAAERGIAPAGGIGGE